jgi:hypothetical protein
MGGDEFNAMEKYQWSYILFDIWLKYEVTTK